MNNLQSILVTGGAGFIGSNFLNYFVPKYPNITFINFDKLVKGVGDLSRISVNHENNYYFERGDINNIEDIRYCYSKYIFGGIINFAAESHVDNSIQDPAPFSLTNVVGTTNLLKIAVEHDIRFHQVSTDEVYGSLDINGHFKEDSPIKPSSPYSASKAGADLIVESFGITFDLNYRITRCTNNYGPHQNFANFIPKVIECALKDKPIPIYGDGSQMREWIHVQDHCRAIMKVFLSKFSNQQIFNVGSGSELELTNLEVAKIILEYLQKPESLIQFVSDRPGHDFRYSVDNSKIYNHTDWCAQIPFHKGLYKTIDHYKSLLGL